MPPGGRAPDKLHCRRTSASCQAATLGTAAARQRQAPQFRCAEGYLCMGFELFGLQATAASMPSSMGHPGHPANAAGGFGGFGFGGGASGAAPPANPFETALEVPFGSHAGGAGPSFDPMHGAPCGVL